MIGQWGLKHVGVDILKHYCDSDKFCLFVGLLCGNWHTDFSFEVAFLLLNTVPLLQLVDICVKAALKAKSHKLDRYKYCMYQHPTPVMSYEIINKCHCYCISISVSKFSGWFISAVFSVCCNVPGLSWLLCMYLWLCLLSTNCTCAFTVLLHLFKCFVRDVH